MNFFKFIKEKISKEKTIHDYGKIGDSVSASNSKVFARLIETEYSLKLELNGKCALSSYYYYIDANRYTFDKLTTICSDINKLISRYTRLGNEMGILENDEIPFKCANCLTTFETNESTCSKCSKDLTIESRCISKGDVIGYINLVKECNPQKWITTDIHE